MENVAPSDSSVNQTTIHFPEVTRWLSSMADRGIYAKDKATRAITALSQLASVLGEDESREPQDVLDQLNDIVNRWIRKNNANPETGRAYSSRARGALSDYLAYQANPKGFSPKPPRVRAKKGDEEAPSLFEEPALKAEVAAPPTPAPTPQAAASVAVQMASSEPAYDLPRVSDMQCYRVKGKEPFFFRLPKEGLTQAEMAAVCFHLFTMTDGFNPLDADFRKITNSVVHGAAGMSVGPADAE